MSPSFFLLMGDLSCAATAEDAQSPNVSPFDRIGESPKSSWTTSLQRPDGNPYDTMVPQTPDNGRMWTPLVHISGGSNKTGYRTVSQCPTLRPKSAVFHTSSNPIEGFNDGVNDSSNPFHAALQSTTESLPSYAALHDVVDDSKTLRCNRTLTFDTFVEKAQLDDDNPSEKAKRRHRDRFRSWMRARAEKLYLMRKSR